MNDISKNIKKLMDKRGFSTYDLADKVGISQQFVSNWINKHDGVSSRRIKPLCYALRCTPNDLFAGCVATLPEEFESDCKAITGDEVKLLQAVRKKDAKYVKALLEVVS